MLHLSDFLNVDYNLCLQKTVMKGVLQRVGGSELSNSEDRKEHGEQGSRRMPSPVSTHLSFEVNQ